MLDNIKQDRNFLIHGISSEKVNTNNVKQSFNYILSKNGKEKVLDCDFLQNITKQAKKISLELKKQITSQAK
mgnify:FL=1